MFEIRTDTRKYTIKDEHSEMYFNACMETLITAELNVVVEKANDIPVAIPSIRGGICVADEKQEEKEEKETVTAEMFLEANKEFSAKEYHPIDYDAANKMAEELVENAERKRKKSFKGFVSIECEHCGEITNTCLKYWQTHFTCNSCHERTPMTDDNMRRVELYCKCGTASSYYTNRADGMFDIECINCGNPVTVEWNKKKKTYVSL